MSTIDEVVQLDETHLRWRASVAGVVRAWTAEVTEQLPDERVAWTSRDGGPSGVVTFHRLDDTTTKVMLQMEVEPEGAKEKLADAMGMLQRQVKKDLENFKKFIEQRGGETGAWRGEIDRRAG